MIQLAKLCFLFVCACFTALAATTEIKVDQVGYLPDAPKVAFVVANQSASEFVVRRKSNDKVVFRGKLSDPKADSDSGDKVQTADFSDVKQQGEFYIEVEGIGRSWNFSISKDVYRRAFYLTMRSFYGQRCGTAVDLGPEFKGYKHAACHLTGAFHSTSGRSGPHSSAKGWHDAGDYGRYVVNSGITTGELLWTYELFGSRIKNLSLNIPESSNKIPDILDEVRWNLDWMLSMQDDDGGVWQKQTSENFADFVMPENDKTISYVIGTGKEPFKNTTATADFAAVMSIAARVFKPYDPAYAQSCLRAAEKAWVWLEKYPNVTFRNSGNVLTGGYGDNDCRDELLWAAAELWRTTKKEDYDKYFQAHYQEQMLTLSPVTPPGWPRVGPLALWSYALDAGGNKSVALAIRAASLKSADRVVERTLQNGYRVSLTKRDYVWGSNAVAANYGVLLLVANLMVPDKRYVEVALDNLHYLLGRNTLSLSFVTQLGEHAFHNPHHRPSQSDSNAEPWPGLLSGGPNQYRNDPAMKKLADLPPAKMYMDDWESYATNEIAINWNAALVFLIAGVMK